MFQVAKHAEWAARWSEDIIVINMKEEKEKVKISERETVCRREKSLTDKLLGGFYDARRKDFQIKNLTEDEINFLFEYVCNS